MLKEHQNICASIRQLSKTLAIKICFALMLGVAFIGGTFGTSVTSVHANASAASQSSIESTIDSVFGPYAGQAKRIAMCESSMNPGATNVQPIGNSHAAGLFQILYPSTWYTTSQASQSPYNATANTIAAHEIFVRDGYSWREWACQP